MCFSEDSLPEMELRPKKTLMHESSTLTTVASESTIGSNRSRSSLHSHHRLLKRSAHEQKNFPPHPYVWRSSLFCVTGGVCSVMTVLFSLWFPFVLTPEAAKNTYIFASYHYNSQESFFDNTAWTFGTDYFLAIVMLYLAQLCLRASDCAATRRLRVAAAGLFTMYAISVTAGGWCHQHYTTLEERNSLRFRMLWTVCVGTVTAAGGFMGACASELMRQLVRRQTPSSSSNSILHGLLRLVQSRAFWAGFGITTTILCALGGFSFQRPACDIFVAGTTQSPPTFFVMGVVALLDAKIPASQHVHNFYRVICILGFILNAPLLPLYSLLVQYTDWSLAAVNTLLHTWLLVAWTMQAISLHHVILAIRKARKSL